MAFRGDKLAVFKRIADASPTSGGNWIKPGRYIFAVEKLLLESKRKGTCFIIELRVIESEATERDAKGELIQPNAPGSKCSNVLNLDKPDVPAAENAKAFLMALYDEKEPTIEADRLKFNEQFAQAMMLVTEPDQPARGLLIADSTFTKDTKAGKEFTGHNWTSIPGQNAEAQAARRKALDEGKPVEMLKAAA